MKKVIVTINGFEGSFEKTKLTKVNYQIGSLFGNKVTWVKDFEDFKEYLKNNENIDGEIILSDDYGEEMSIEDFDEFMKPQDDESEPFFTEWYAIQEDEDDNDWGDGSFDKDEAIKMARERGYKYVATIEGEWDVDGEPITEGICTEVEEV